MPTPPRSAPRQPHRARPKAPDRPAAPLGPRPAQDADELPTGTRLQKLLSQAGIASRRGAEALIRKGLVTVDGRLAVLGERVDPAVQTVAVEGRHVTLDPAKHYFVLNKPEGVITTAKDPEGRPTVLDMMGIAETVFPVGRLDAATSGLLLLTNDGELAHRLAHPSYEVPRTYLAEVTGRPGRIVVRRLTEEGVSIGDGETAIADRVTVLDALPSKEGDKEAHSLLEIVVHEGRKHVIRRMLSAVNCPVVRLVRTQFGPLRLERLAPGSYRRLSLHEVAELYKAVDL